MIIKQYDLQSEIRIDWHKDYDISRVYLIYNAYINWPIRGNISNVDMLDKTISHYRWDGEGKLNLHHFIRVKVIIPLWIIQLSNFEINFL